MSTVNTILKRSVQIGDQPEMDHIVLVFDQVIYAKNPANPLEERWLYKAFSDQTR